MKLQIKVMWCKGISAFNFFQKLTPYIVVSIHTIDERLALSESQKQEQRTQVDDEGDANPEWNHTMNFVLDDTMLSNLRSFLLLFEIKNHGNILSDKNIGDVKVPLRDLVLVQSVGNGVARFASYEVRSIDGKSNGVLDFSYKVMGEHCVDHAGQSGPSDLDRVDYPTIGIDGYGGNVAPSAPPLLGGEENGLFQGYPPSVYPPPGPAMWTPLPPPPRPQPVAYRPPPEEYYSQHNFGSPRPPPDEYYSQHNFGSPRPPPDQYYGLQHSGSGSYFGYNGSSHWPPPEEHYNQHHSGSLRPLPEEYYNQHHSSSESCCGYHAYGHRPPPPAPTPGEQYYHQHSNSSGGGGGGYHHW